MAIQGYCTGTSSIFAALTTDYDWFKERTYKVAMFMPCAIADSTKDSFNGELKEAYKANDIFEEGGPTWYLTAGKLAKVGGLEFVH